MILLIYVIEMKFPTNVRHPLAASLELLLSTYLLYQYHRLLPNSNKIKITIIEMQSI